MNYRYENSGETGILTLNGELNAQCTDDLMEVLMMSLGNSEHLVVDLERVTVLDPSCHRLFSIARTTSSLLKKKVTFTGPRADELERFAEKNAVTA